MDSHPGKPDAFKVGGMEDLARLHEFNFVDHLNDYMGVGILIMFTYCILYPLQTSSYRGRPNATRTLPIVVHPRPKT